MNAWAAAGCRLDQPEEIQAAEELAAATAAAAARAMAAVVVEVERNQRRSELRSQLGHFATLLLLFTLIGFGLFVLNGGDKVSVVSSPAMATASMHTYTPHTPAVPAIHPAFSARLRVVQPNASPSHPAQNNDHPWLLPMALTFGSCTVLACCHCCCCFNSPFFDFLVERGVRRTVDELDDSTSNASFGSSV